MIRNKKISLIIILLIIVFDIVVFSLPITNSTTNIKNIKVSSSEDWVNSWGYNETDHGYSIATDSNGNVYVAGDINEESALNATIIKYNSNGIFQWDRTWGGSSSERAYSVFVDDSDSIFITGSSRSFNTSQDLFIAQYNSDGDLIWNETWGGSDSDFGQDLIVDNQGNLLITGTTSSFGFGDQDIFLLTFNSTGYLQNKTVWGGTLYDRSKSIVKDSIGNIYIMGETGSFGVGNSDVFLLKYDRNQNLVWNTTWGTSTLDRPGDMTIDSNDNLYISGFTYHPDLLTGDENFFIVKISSSGLPVWSQIWGTKYIDIGGSVSVDSKDNVYYSANTEGYNAGIKDIYLTKFTSSGNQIWETLWDSGDNDFVHQICIDPSTDNIHLVGESKGFTLDKNYQIITIKNPSIPEETGTSNPNQSIYGYNIVFVIFIISIVSIIIIIRKTQFKKS